MLKKLCPYHKGKVNHTFEECDMLRKYFNCLSRKDEAKKEKDKEVKGSNGYPLNSMTFTRLALISLSKE